MINIIRLPKEINIDKRIYNKMLEVYGTCPYCNKNTSRTYEVWASGIRPIGKNGLFKKKEYEWRKIRFHCCKCDMIWESPSYPVVGNDVDANNAIFHAWQEGKNMEVNTLLLTVINEKEK